MINWRISPCLYSLTFIFDITKIFKDRQLLKAEEPCNLLVDLPWRAQSLCPILSHQSCSRLSGISFSCKITGSANLPQLLQDLFIKIYYDLCLVSLVPARGLGWFLLSPFLHYFDTGNIRSESRPRRNISLSYYTADLFSSLSAVVEQSTSRHSVSICVL